MKDYILEQARRLTKQYGTRDSFELIDALHIHLMIRDNLGGLKGFYYTQCRERYVVVNGGMNERDQLLVAAHELGHDRLHRQLARVSPLKDFAFYEVTSHTEYEANLFASELLVSDDDVEDCVEEGMDYLSMCRTLGFHPQLMAFKLYGMVQRGFQINLPEMPNGRFLGK